MSAFTNEQLNGVILFAICIIVPKCVTGTFGEERYPFAYSSGELFFVRKVPLTPSKDRFVKNVPLSADSGLGLCPKTLPPFEKGGRKLLVFPYFANIEKKQSIASNK